ncbi:MAG: hypothetical protein V4548_00910 [Bacteroidota bacterium]
MKRFLGLLICAFVINSCDDGDVEVKNISFSDIETSASCGEIVYKFNAKELLLIKIPESELAYTNTVGVQTFPISTTNRVIYRNYDGTPTADNICSNPPAATPNVTEEWNGIGGTIEITTTAVKDVNNTTHATRIIKYNHYIVFKNIVFQKPNGNQTYDSFVFGDYSTPSTLIYPFETSQQLKKCDTAPLVYNQIGNEALIITNIDASLIANSATPTVRTMPLGTSINVLNYNIYNGPLPLDFFCSGATSPTLTEPWIADLTLTSGSIEVTTSVVMSGANTQYTHKIHLKNVTLSNGMTNFYLGDDFYYGDLIVE